MNAALWHRLVDDAAMFPPGNAGPVEAVARHVEYRTGPYATLIGPLVVADTALSAVDRAVGASGTGPVEVSVVLTTGAGGLVSVAGRDCADLVVVAVEGALRDLDDLAGNARRMVQAATVLDEAVRVFVEMPYAPGWEAAVEVVEAAGLLGKIRTGGTEPAAYPTSRALADQLRVLVEADLPFKATAGLHRAWRNTAHPAAGGSLEQHGVLNLLAAAHALVEGSALAEVEAILDEVDPSVLAGRVRSWSDDDVGRVRRRFRSFGCCGVLDPIGDLTALELV